MAAIPLNQDRVAKIIAEWRTGNYTQRDLASKHRVSVGYINKYVKDVKRDTAETVNKLVQGKQELSLLDEQAVNAVNDVVHERTKHIQFFTNAALKNVATAVKKISSETSQAEHKMLSETILRGKETVLGKDPDTAIQINTNEPPRTRDEFYSR